MWNSNRDLDTTPETPKCQARNLRARKSSRTRRSANALEFLRSSSPSCAKPVDRPPGGAGWGHEVKFDGYRLQLRIANGEVTLKTRKGLDWTHKFQAIADAAAEFPNAIIDGEVAALDENGSPDFAALQAALSEERTDDLIFFAFDLHVQRRRRPALAVVARSQGCVARTIWTSKDRTRAR